MGRIIGTTLLLLLIILSGCSNNNDKNIKKVTSNKTIEADKGIEVSQNAANEDTKQEVMGLTIKEKVNQLGNEPLEGKFDQFSDIAIGHKDGFTYVLNPIQDKILDQNNDLSKYVFKFNLSIADDKNNKWKIKNKDIDVSKEIYIKNSWLYPYEFKLKNFGHYIVVIAYEKPADGNESVVERVHLFEFEENGDYHHTLAKEYSTKPTEDLPNYTFVYGVDGDLYLLEHKNTNINQGYSLYDKAGKQLYTFKDESELLYESDYKIDYDKDLIFEPSKGTLYYFSNQFSSRREHHILLGYDVKQDDLVWDEAGDVKEFVAYPKCENPLGEIANNRFAGGVNGYYNIFTSICDRDSVNVSYNSIFEKHIVVEKSIEIPSDLPDKDVYYIGLDEENINIYKYVEYKGKPTIQKYVLTRIDNKTNNASLPDDSVSSSNVGGIYSFDEGVYRGSVEIYDQTASGFKFLLQTVYKQSTGEISGEATLNGNKAVFNTEDGCKLDFSFSDKKVEVKASNSCSPYGGLNIMFDGAYIKEDVD